MISPDTRGSGAAIAPAEHSETSSGMSGVARAVAERRREILRADPYYPHTVLRAVVIWLIHFLVLVGCSALVMFSMPGRHLEWDDLLVPLGVSAVTVGFSYLFRADRVQQQENWGRISTRT